MAKKKEPKVTEMTVADAVSDCISTLNELGQEMQDWYDNMPENLQSGSKGDAVSEAADALSSLSEPDIPEVLGELKFKHLWFPNKRASRAARRDNAVAPLYSAIDFLQQKKDEEEDEEEDTITTLIEDITTLIEEADAVEFPGMYG